MGCGVGCCQGKVRILRHVLVSRENIDCARTHRSPSRELACCPVAWWQTWKEKESLGHVISMTRFVRRAVTHKEAVSQEEEEVFRNVGVFPGPANVHQSEFTLWSAAPENLVAAGVRVPGHCTVATLYSFRASRGPSRRSVRAGPSGAQTPPTKGVPACLLASRLAQIHFGSSPFSGSNISQA